MQAKAFNFFPLKLSSPAVKLPPAKAILFPDNAAPDISIALPSPDILTSVKDQKVQAYWDYQFLFVSQRSETANPVTLRVIEGSIPSDFPLGTYYLTGPGLFRDDHGSTVNPLDGHGYLRAFTIDGVKGEVTFMAKYIETSAQVEEHNRETGEWRFTHRGPFSVLKNGHKFGNTKVMKNVANTSVLKWGDRLFCLWEGGAPYEIDSTSLDTLGKFDLIKHVDESSNTSSSSEGDRVMGGDNMLNIATSILKPILYGIFKMPPKRLLSHYKIDASRNRLLMMSCNAEDMLLPRSNFTFYEFDSDFKVLHKQEFTLPEHLMIHDWAFTDSHYILFGNRIKLDILGSMTALCGLSPMISALSVNPSKSTSPIYLLPRFLGKEGERDWRVPVEAPSQMWVLHVANAFQEIDQNGHTQIQIQASSCSYKWFNFQKMFGYDWETGKLDPGMMNICEEENKLLPHVIQVSINLDASGNCEKCSVNPLNDQWNKTTDFPVMNTDFGGSDSTYVYAATSLGLHRELPHFPFDTVVKFDTVKNSTQTWSVGERRFIGEPIFISKGGDEDDGYLLVVEYAVSKQMCYLVILDAKKVGETDAVVARLEVPKYLNFPLGFHGFWAPKTT